jgi:predicted DNA-binding protein
MLTRIEDDDYKALEALAKKQERPVSWLVRFILNEYIAEHTESQASPAWQSRVYGGKRDHGDE